MRLVVAIGGNALLKRGDVMSAEIQRANMAAAAQSLAEACRGHEVAMVHGNGPQVGLLAIETGLYPAAPPYPFDILGAESQGMIGYIIAQALQRAMPDRAVAALLTRVRVDPADTAFSHPDKPVGPFYEAGDIAALSPRGWTFARDGDKMRRVVPSPAPAEIIELPAIESLMASGFVTICCGGGGIPVDGSGQGMEAVVDKDWTAALLAESLMADRLVILTDVDGVYADWDTRDKRLLSEISPDMLQGMSFAKGSMAPKVAAACRFAANTGKPAVIGNLHDAGRVIAGKAGTKIGVRLPRS